MINMYENYSFAFSWSKNSSLFFFLGIISLIIVLGVEKKKSIASLKFKLSYKHSVRNGFKNQGVSREIHVYLIKKKCMTQ